MSDKKFKQLNPNFNLNTYRKDLTQSLIVEMFKIIEAEAQLYGKDFGLEVKTSLLASFVSTLVYQALVPAEADAAINANRKYEITLKSFEEMKELIRRSVEEGFSGGFQAFNPSVVPDYQCDITCLDSGDVNSISN